MPAGQLHLYRFIEDAWSGGLSAWCESAQKSPGLEPWLLVENAGQTRWLARKLLRSATTFRIFDPDELRDELALRSGLDLLPRNPALASLAVKVASRRAGEISRDPAILAQAAQFLSIAGMLPGAFERKLQAALPVQPIAVCCVGWDAARWPDVGLLELLIEKCAAFEMFVPSPRLPADTLHHEWIENLEQRLALDRTTCPESGFTSQNELLVARLEASNPASHDVPSPPILLVGREWPDQVALVCEQVTAWLAANPNPEFPIGIVSPEDSPTAISVAETLSHAGIQVESPARIREPGPNRLIVEQIARYYLNANDIADFLDLTRLLFLHAPEAWPALEPEPVHAALDRAFNSAQTRNTRVLVRAIPWQSNPASVAIRRLVEALNLVDGRDVLWPLLCGKWDAMLAAMRLPGDAFPALTSRVRALFPHQSVPAQAFMEWIADELAAGRRQTVPPDYATRARVVVTTFSQAAQQTWDRLIFLDCNEHIWPAFAVENPYLPDATRVRANVARDRPARLLTTRDLRALDQARFLDLLEHCRGPFALAGLLLDQTEAGDHAQPNEWVLRTLLETAPGTFPPDLWAAGARAIPTPPSTALDPAEQAHIQLVHSARRNPAIPFDRYQFNFNETKLEPGPWSATALDQAITSPATFALAELFSAQSTAGWNPTRQEPAAFGNRAHRWLARILSVRGRLSPAAPVRDDEAKLVLEFAAARRELQEWFAADGLPIPIWWETCLRKTEWATRRCLRELRRSLAGEYCAMEQNLTVVVRTPTYKFPLKGRIDILTSDQPQIPGARIRMFDFKTGRGEIPTLSSLQKGYGAQFAAYYLMARDAGAAEAAIGIIKPEDRARDVFGSADEEALRAWFGRLAGLRQSLRFGRLGPLVSEHGATETLPLATTPIDPAILAQKAALLLLAS